MAKTPTRGLLQIEVGTIIIKNREITRYGAGVAHLPFKINSRDLTRDVSK